MHFRTLANPLSLSLALLITAQTLPAAAQLKAGAKVVATVPAGAFPVAVDVNFRTGKVYVPNNSSPSVTIIDERTKTSKTVVDAGGSFPNAIAVNFITNKIYVANTESGNVLVSISF
jgi:DNA-binding beta-propeller fold protein YncE